MQPRTYVITGGSNGLGYAIGEAILSGDPFANVWSLSLTDSVPPGVIPLMADVSSPASLAKVRVNLPLSIDVLINCAGVNHIDWIGDLEEADWDRVMNTNAKGIYVVSRSLLPRIVNAFGGGTIVNIISNAAHVPMTGSLAYNASKGAAHIMTLQMARELTRRYGTTVFGIAPNKLSGTGMSRYIEARVPEHRGWTPQQAHEYQRSALLRGEETPPEAVAELLAYLLSKPERHRYLTGCILPYGA